MKSGGMGGQGRGSGSSFNLSLKQHCVRVGVHGERNKVFHC